MLTYYRTSFSNEVFFPKTIDYVILFWKILISFGKIKIQPTVECLTDLQIFITRLISLTQVTFQLFISRNKHVVEEMSRKTLWSVNNLTSIHYCVESHQNNKKCLHSSHLKEDSAKLTWMNFAKFVAILQQSKQNGTIKIMWWRHKM